MHIAHDPLDDSDLVDTQVMVRPPMNACAEEDAEPLLLSRPRLDAADEEADTLVFARPRLRPANDVDVDEEADTLVQVRCPDSPSPTPPEGPARSCLVDPGKTLPAPPGNRWPGAEQEERKIPRSEGQPDWHATCTGVRPAGTEDDMAPMGIEYDVVDLEGDLEGGPVELRRHVPEEIAMLSGSLFDKLPKHEVPLETFFPAEYHGSPTWHRARSDSLIPVAAEPESGTISPRPVGPGWYMGMAAAVVIGLLAGALAQRPSAPATAAQPAATTKAPVAQIAAQTPVVEAPKAEPAAPKPASGSKRILSGTAPVAANVVPASRVAPVAPETTEKASGTEPVLENMPIAPPPPPKAPEVPAQQSTSVAVASAARGAASCFGPDELRRTMAVSVTFAPSGRVTQAIVQGGPHRGTAIGSCIAQHLRGASVKPFEGPAMTVRTSIHIR